jgi:hypothetical protein
MRIMFLICVLMLSFGAMAAEETSPADDLGAAVAQQREIRTALETNAPEYNYLSKNRRQNVLSAQDRLFAMTDGKASLGELSPNDRVRAFNQLKRIEALLVRKDVDEQQVCESSQLVGSHQRKLICYSKAEQNGRRDRAKDSMTTRSACTNSECQAGNF